MPRRWNYAALLPLCVSLACGPKPPAEDTGADSDGTSTTTTAATTGTTDATTTTTTTTGTTTGAVPTTTDAVTGSGTDSSSTTVSFIVPNDGGTCVAAFGEYELRCGECDVWNQDCPEGSKCNPSSGDGDNSWESTICVPIDPNPGQVGDACTVEGGGASGHDSCDISSMCWDLDEDTMMGTCVGFCTGSPDQPMCPPGLGCTIANDGVLILCLPQCDPLLQDCANANLCIPNPMDPNSFICVVDASGEEGQAFDPCEYANACDPGLACLSPELASECDPMSSGCCTPFCDTTMPDCLGAMQECLPWFEMDMAPPGYENLGVCGLPQ